MAKTVRIIDSLREPEAFRGWLASIAVSQVHRRLARQRLLKFVGLNQGLEDAPLDELAREDLSIEARSELAALDLVPPHNNMSKLALRREAVGRKNWLFVGSDEGGAVNATFVSLLAMRETESLRNHDESQGSRYAVRRTDTIGRFIVDFLAPSIELEVDGGYHAQRVAADQRRDRRLAHLGYRAVRVSDALVRSTPSVAVSRVRALLG